MSPSCASSSETVPLAGAGSSTSTLSVEISTIVSLALMRSPTCARHSRIVPSLTDSPAAGVTTSTSRPLAALPPFALPPFVAAGAASRAAASPTAIRAITWPTVTVSPSSTSSSITVPAAGAGSSTSTLSVEISTIVSSALT